MASQLHGPSARLGQIAVSTSRWRNQAIYLIRQVALRCMLWLGDCYDAVANMRYMLATFGGKEHDEYGSLGRVGCA